MKKDGNTPDNGMYEDWSDTEIQDHMCLRLLFSLTTTFSDAFETLKNSGDLFNGKTAETLDNLRKKRKSLEKYQNGEVSADIKTLVDAGLAKIDEFIGNIEKKLEDPNIQQQIEAARKNLKNALN